MIFNFLLLPLAIFAASCQVKADNGNSESNNNDIIEEDISEEVAKEFLRENISVGDLFQGDEEKSNAMVDAARQNGLFFSMLLYDILYERGIVYFDTSGNIEGRVSYSLFFRFLPLNDNFEANKKELLTKLIEKIATLEAPIEQINGIIRTFTQMHREDLVLEDATDSNKVNEVVDKILTILQDNPIRVVRMMFHLLSLIPVNLSDLHNFLDSIGTSLNIDNFQGNLTRSLVNKLKRKVKKDKFTPISKESLRKEVQISQPSDIITEGIFDNPDYNAELAKILTKNDRFFIHAMFEALYADREIAERSGDIGGAIILGTAQKELIGLSFPDMTKRQIRLRLRDSFPYADVSKINEVISDILGNNSIQLPSELFKDFNGKSSELTDEQELKIDEVLESIQELGDEVLTLRLVLSLVVLRGVDLNNIGDFVKSLNLTFHRMSEEEMIETLQGVVDSAKNKVTQMFQ